MKIVYRMGDATNPQGEGNKVIAHICNNVGAWGAGFVLALSRKWSAPEENYKNILNPQLGNVEFVTVEDGLVVANMVAQDDIISRTKAAGIKSPIRYDALVDCLMQVNKFCQSTDNTIASLHLPRIGAGLAGGNWRVIEALIEEHINVPVFVYDLQPVAGVQYELPEIPWDK